MFPREQEGALPGPAARSSPREGGSEPSIFLRYAARRLALLTAFVIVGFLLGIWARFLIDDPASRDVANYVRSGLHGSGVAFTAWGVQRDLPHLMATPAEFEVGEGEAIALRGRRERIEAHAVEQP